MKKIGFLAFMVIFVLGLVGCDTSNGLDISPNPDTYIVLDVSEHNLLVAEVGQDGRAMEKKQYSLRNVFYPSDKIRVGEEIIINHNGEIRESFPMQFGRIYSIEYYDHETGLNVIVTID